MTSAEAPINLQEDSTSCALYTLNNILLYDKYYTRGNLPNGFSWDQSSVNGTGAYAFSDCDALPALFSQRFSVNVIQKSAQPNQLNAPIDVTDDEFDPSSVQSVAKEKLTASDLLHIIDTQNPLGIWLHVENGHIQHGACALPFSDGWHVLDPLYQKAMTISEYFNTYHQVVDKGLTRLLCQAPD